MSDTAGPAARFEENRGHLRAVAYRLLGSLSEAEEAVQETWLRAGAVNTDSVENLRSWLTTVVGRVCLNVLRARRSRIDSEIVPMMPDPIVSPLGESEIDPERAALVANSVGLAMLVILDTVRPDERLAFVLHDIFGVQYRDVSSILERSLSATRRLASRARRRVRVASVPDVDLERQRLAVDAFFAAAREGDSNALESVLHPDAVLRSDGGRSRPSATTIIRGAREVAVGSVEFGAIVPLAHAAIINGGAGIVAIRDGRIISVIAFTVTGGGITAINVLADPGRLDHIDAAAWP
jgi:RNA polymerase sigma-70 factor (ECF subfamily)